jgi:hypothetical protein
MTTRRTITIEGRTAIAHTSYRYAAVTVASPRRLQVVCTGDDSQKVFAQAWGFGAREVQVVDLDTGEVVA